MNPDGHALSGNALGTQSCEDSIMHSRHPYAVHVAFSQHSCLKCHLIGLAKLAESVGEPVHHQGSYLGEASLLAHSRRALCPQAKHPARSAKHEHEVTSSEAEQLRVTEW